jgi:multisubunit Na+/H+ antiporter MnhB subunit
MLIQSLLAAIAAVALVMIAAFAFKKYGKQDDEPSGPTVGHAGAMLSALFLLVLSIAIIVPWTTVDAARQNTYAETQSLSEAYWAAGSLPAVNRQMVRDGLTDYVRFVADTEWPDMAHGRLSEVGWRKLDAIRVAVRNMQFNDDSTKAVRDNVSERLREVYAARQQRTVDARTSLPTGVLVFTVITGLIMIIFPFLAGARPRGMAMAPLVVMAVMLCVCIYTVFDIDHTFTGALAVGPDAFTAALQGFTRIP